MFSHFKFVASPPTGCQWFLAIHCQYGSVQLQLKDITQAHYDDIIEERGITKLCGYPLCDKKLENPLTKKYHISLSQKKVYDLTERKNFCGSQCFKASNYLKAQLLTTPLWSRKQDDVLPEFSLLDLTDT